MFFYFRLDICSLVFQKNRLKSLIIAEVKILHVRKRPLKPLVQAELQILQSDKITFKKDISVVSTDLSFLFANKTAETLDNSGSEKISLPATSVKRETLALFGQNSP